MLAEFLTAQFLLKAYSPSAFSCKQRGASLCKQLGHHDTSLNRGFLGLNSVTEGNLASHSEDANINPKQQLGALAASPNSPCSVGRGRHSRGRLPGRTPRRQPKIGEQEALGPWSRSTQVRQGLTAPESLLQRWAAVISLQSKLNSSILFRVFPQQCQRNHTFPGICPGGGTSTCFGNFSVYRVPKFTHQMGN